MIYYIVAVAKAANGSILGLECDDNSHFTKSTVIQKMSNGDYFYTKSGASEAIVITSDFNGKKFIKSAADGLPADNLGNLPLCQHTNQLVWK